jgi:hypothetical protein
MASNPSQNYADHTTTTQRTKGRNPAWKQGRGNYRGQGRGRNNRGRNNSRVYPQHQTNQGYGSYYHHGQQQYQQPSNTYYQPNYQEIQEPTYTYPGQQHHPLAPNEPFFHQYPPHDRQLSPQEQNDFEHFKYHGHRRKHSSHSSTHFNLAPLQQQNLEMKKYQQQQNWDKDSDKFWEEFKAFDSIYQDLIEQGVYTSRGCDFMAAYDHIYGQEWNKPRVRKIRTEVYELIMPNGTVEYQYAY